MRRDDDGWLNHPRVRNVGEPVREARHECLIAHVLEPLTKRHPFGRSMMEDARTVARWFSLNKRPALSVWPRQEVGSACPCGRLGWRRTDGVEPGGKHCSARHSGVRGFSPELMFPQPIGRWRLAAEGSSSVTDARDRSNFNSCTRGSRGRSYRGENTRHLKRGTGGANCATLNQESTTDDDDHP